MTGTAPRRVALCALRRVVRRTLLFRPMLRAEAAAHRRRDMLASVPSLAHSGCCRLTVTLSICRRGIICMGTVVCTSRVVTWPPTPPITLLKRAISLSPKTSSGLPRLQEVPRMERSSLLSRCRPLP